MQIYTLPDNRQLTQGQAFKHPDGRSFPANFLQNATLDDLAAHGITVEEIPEPEPEPPTVEDLLDYLGRKRVAVEEGGIALNGMAIATDRAVSQVKIAGAWAKANADPTFSISNWKVSPGVFVPLANETILAVGDAVTVHVQACFDKEAELAAAILAEPPTITTYEEIDAADWPSNG